MSTRAYKIIEIKTNPEPTFNCWHQSDILDLATNLDQYNGDSGMLEFEKIILEEYLATAKKTIAKPTKEEQEYMDTLAAMIADCGHEEYVTYHCF